MFLRKPIIGIAGGIGSGKSFVASLFGQLGCQVIDSDQQVREAYRDGRVKTALRTWWGDKVFDADGAVDRRAVARLVFDDPPQRERLEALLHPIVAERRDAAMREAAADPSLVAFVWDTPLLFEAGLAGGCDAIVFVDAPREVRLARVRAARGWDEAELDRRQNLQWPLDKKHRMSHHVIRNTADVGVVRDQVRVTLSRILAATSKSAVPQAYNAFGRGSAADPPG